ncbi:hypothetical protein BCR36DRAFT_291290 [Piromyces finnis]|uniref:Uncharacterized protein n=1 Tax=Piromyces finnis TaxID=1754191 RepID=A0A1Y1V8F3_9FUNG|nr:hypothetical protein BCR36DRAFT_291290 [Piromyces finnis]|eukprot:ORX49691.1 hypothetical protein BCR36DRAFT_291290 [Piromyces finnis]
MEILYETLDLLDQYEKEKKNTISLNSTATIIQKEDIKNQKEEEGNSRQSTTESNITRINSARSSDSFKTRSNSDIDEEDIDIESDEEFKSFPDETSFNYQHEKENIKYDSNYYEYISQKGNGNRINSFPVSDNHMFMGRSRSNSSLSTPELLIYDSNEYDSSNSCSSLNEKMRWNQSFTYGSSDKIISNLSISNNIINKSLSGNKIFQNNQLISSSSETILNDIENSIKGDFSNRNSNSSNLSASSYSDFLIPQRSISLLDSTRKARQKSFVGQSNPSCIPSPSLSSPITKPLNIKINNQKDTDNSQSDSSKTVPPSPSTPNDLFIGPTSNSFSVSSSSDSLGNMYYSKDYNVHPISALYRKNSLGSKDQRISRSFHDKSLKNDNYYESNRSRSMSPSHRKSSLSILPGNINTGIIKSPSISSEYGRKESFSSPLSQNNPIVNPIVKNTPPPSPHPEIKSPKDDLPHKYINKLSLESEVNVKEAGYHIGQNQNNIDKSIIDKIDNSNLSDNDNHINVRNSVLSVQSISTVNSRLNSNDSNYSNVSKKSSRVITNDTTTNSLLNSYYINCNNGTSNTTTNNKIVRDNIILPVNKRKSSIPKQPVFYQEPYSEVSKPKKIISSKESEKEIFSTLIQLLDQLECNQQQNNKELIDTSDADATIHKALNHLEKAYFPEGLAKNEYKTPLIPDSIAKSPNIDNNIKKYDVNNQTMKKEQANYIQDDFVLTNINMNSPARIRGQEELQRILNNSAPSLQVKSKKERAKQQQQYMLLQLQQKQEIRVKKIQQQQQQQQQLQNQLKQQINQKLKQNAMIQQKLKQFGSDSNSYSVSNSLRMINPEYNLSSPMSELSTNEFSDANPRRFDSITPVISPVSTHASIENISAVSISPRPRKTSFNSQHLIPIPQINNGKDSSSLLSTSYESIKEFKSCSPIVSTISVNNTKPSPNQSFTNIPMKVPSLGNSPSIQSKNFTIDINSDVSIPGIQQHKIYSRSPSTQCVDISSSELAKKQRKSKKTSIFYIPPDNSSKPLSAVVSDISDVNSISDDLDIITKNNTIINSNSNATNNINYNAKTSLYKNGNYNLSADNLPLLRKTAEESNYFIKKSNSIGSKLNNYDIVDERQIELKKFDIEGQTFVERFMNELNVTTGFENNILKQRAQQQEEERREKEIRRRTLNMQNQLANSINNDISNI